MNLLTTIGMIAAHFDLSRGITDFRGHNVDVVTYKKGSIVFNLRQKD